MAVHMITGDRGDEIRVETGVGRIVEVKRPRKPEQRNVQVVIDAEHLREDVTAWVDKQGPLWPRVQHAQPADDESPGMQIWYRVDVHRKAKTDPSIPLAEVGKHDKVRDLVGLERPENAPATIEGAAPPPAATPRNTPQPAAADKPVDTARAAEIGEDATAAKVAWLDKLDQAIATGEPPQQVEWLREQCLEVGCTTTQVDAVIRSRREHLARTVPTAAAEHAVTIPEETTSGTIERGTDARDPRWEIPPEAGDQAQVHVLIAKAEQGGKIGQAAEDQLKRMGVARRAVAEAADPDAVGATRPPAVVPDESRAPTSGQTSRPSVAPVSGLSRRSQAIASDGKPWDFTNTDGRVNLSSYAAGAVMELTNLAGRLLVTRARSRHDEDPAQYPLEAPTAQQVFGLAQTLLSIADTIQHRARDGGRVDRMAASYRLARQALREGLDLYPVPWGAERDDVESWRGAVIEHGVTMIDVGLALLNGERTVRPPAEAEPAATG